MPAKEGVGLAGSILNRFGKPAYRFGGLAGEILLLHSPNVSFTASGRRAGLGPAPGRPQGRPYVLGTAYPQEDSGLSQRFLERPLSPPRPKGRPARRTRTIPVSERHGPRSQRRGGSFRRLSPGLRGHRPGQSSTHEVPARKTGLGFVIAHRVLPGEGDDMSESSVEVKRVTPNSRPSTLNS